MPMWQDFKADVRATVELVRLNVLAPLWARYGRPMVCQLIHGGHFWYRVCGWKACTRCGLVRR